ncbi:MAG: hypothetical protein J6X55_01980, partial [Victivallales bacterium]|nr:hypothetical protein [Victivallales bacterium]
LVPYNGRRAAILQFFVTNTGRENAELSIQFEVTGGLARASHWGFSKPRNAPPAQAAWNRGVFSLNNGNDKLAFASTLKIRPHLPVCSGVLDAPPISVPQYGTETFYVFMALAPARELNKLIAEIKSNPLECCEKSRRFWEERVKRLYSIMPNFSSDNKAWEKLYDRSLLHLLLNEWNVPDFKLHPYYSTGGINGGCIGCYLWNYGEPYRLWSMLNQESAKEHLRTFLNLDLTNCFAFNPDDGTPFGPYYPINQEKVVFLAHAYVMQTRDIGFLNEVFNGKTILEHLIQQALAHDDISQNAVLVDYGDGNHHLELRRQLRYDGIVPDLNLRRCVVMQLTADLCELVGDVSMAGTLRQRADALKSLISKKLFDKKDGWYWAIDCHGKQYLRWTMQLFKALGWNGWAMDKEQEEALIKHLMNTDEFLGDYGIHSLSKLDLAYDEFDIDNGGPGACISFTPAIIDRLYRNGHVKDAGNLFKRLQWLAESLPYWGDSQRADIREYRRDTPLQNDIQGAAIAQTFIFGMFGIEIRKDFSIEITPHLPDGTDVIRLMNVHLAGKVFSIECTRQKGVVVKDGKRRLTAKNGESVIL